MVQDPHTSETPDEESRAHKLSGGYGSGNVDGLVADVRGDVETNVQLGKTAQKVYDELCDLAQHARDGSIADAGAYDKVNWLVGYDRYYREIDALLEKGRVADTHGCINPFKLNSGFSRVYGGVRQSVREHIDIRFGSDYSQLDSSEEFNQWFKSVYDAVIAMPERFMRSTYLINVLNEADRMEQQEGEERRYNRERW